jgi:predicted permease
MTGFFRDTVRSLRGWRRTPGSALLVILALGLSGGALLALVTLFNALLWRELPVPRPGELVGVTGTDGRRPIWVPFRLPPGLFASLDQAEQVFQEFAGFHSFDSVGVISNSSQRLAVQGVSGRYFDTLGVRPERGRLIDPGDIDAVSAVATISFRSWQTRFGADPNVIGQTFRLHGEVVTIIGIAPRAFTGVEVGMPADAWVPMSFAPRLLSESPDLIWFNAFVGRLRPGVTLDQARLQLEALWPQARQTAAESATLPGLRDYTLELEPRIESAARGFSQWGLFYRRTLVLLLLACAVTIVISCANLSGLLLARWSTREVDVAVQAALGASRARLVSQVVGESLTLSMVAAILSTPLALWSARGLVLLVWDHPEAVPLDLGLDVRVLGVMAVLVCAVALSVSVLPASRVWSSNLALVRGSRGAPGRAVTRWGRWLTAAQVALSVPLFVTAWIVAANLHRLERADTGFRAHGVTTVGLTSQGGVAPVADPAAYFTNLARTLSGVPGISSAALGAEPGRFGSPLLRPVTGDDGLRRVNAFFLQVSPGYFETLSVPLVAGRDFAWTDNSSQRPVAIVSQGLSGELLAGSHPIGQRVRLGDQTDRVFDVIGVVADVRLAEPHHANQRFLFTALPQQSPRYLQALLPGVLLKSPLPPRELQPLVRRAIASLGRHDVLSTRPLEQAMAVPLLKERVMRLGALYFAGLTTLLVFVGLYAVLNLGVTRRIPEIGLRLALGASTQNIRVLVIREALFTAAAGLAIGVPTAFAASRLVVSSLGLTGSGELLAFGAAVALILVVTVLSVLAPLRRASRVTPVEALAHAILRAS